MKKHIHDNTNANQRLIILRWLKQHKSMSTFDARTKLGIMHPGGRVLELRRRGHNIITHWSVEHDPLNKPHRVARYILLPGNYRGTGRASYVI
jgi:hypothetical protein